VSTSPIHFIFFEVKIIHFTADEFFMFYFPHSIRLSIVGERRHLRQILPFSRLRAGRVWNSKRFSLRNSNPQPHIFVFSRSRFFFNFPPLPAISQVRNLPEPELLLCLCPLPYNPFVKLRIAIHPNIRANMFYLLT
jgi:hypothetical protein